MKKNLIKASVIASFAALLLGIIDSVISLFVNVGGKTIGTTSLISNTFSWSRLIWVLVITFVVVFFIVFLY